MAHKHYCGTGGHEWQCENPDCGCICGELMEEGDHSDCAVELRDCPQHLDGLQPGEVAGGVQIQFPPDLAKRVTRGIAQGKQYAGFCIWCGHGYDRYTRKIEAEHLAYDCPNAPKKLKDDLKRRLPKRCTRRR